jgi:hypothetical protein
VIAPRTRARRVGASLFLAAILTQSLNGQGRGASVSLGVYRSNSRADYRQAPGIATELMGHWTSPSGFVLGVGARGIRFQDGPRGTAFLDGRYAPVPSASQRIRPIVGLRTGPYLDGTGTDLVYGLDVGALAGLALRLGTGVSLTVLGDLGLPFAIGGYSFTRAFLPGLMMGLRFN